MSGMPNDELKPIEHLTIRVASSGDRLSIEDVYRASVGDALPLEDPEWERWLTGRSLLVAEIGDMVIGFGGIDVGAKEQLKWLFLLPEFQQRGIGSRLLAELENVGWRYGLQSIRLHSAPQSEAFYRKAGYIAVDRDSEIAHDHNGIQLIKTRRHDGG